MTNDIAYHRHRLDRQMMMGSPWTGDQVGAAFLIPIAISSGVIGSIMGYKLAAPAAEEVEKPTILEKSATAVGEGIGKSFVTAAAIGTIGYLGLKLLDKSFK